MLLAIAFLVAAGAAGLAASRKFGTQNRIAYAIPLAIVFSTWAVFALSLALGLNAASVGAATAILLAFAWLNGKKQEKRGEKTFAGLLDREMLPLAIISLAFFLAINFAMFHYDARGAVEGYSTDFGFHKSVISSLANGNFPPEHPLFSGRLLSYYYFMHLFTATLAIGGFSLQYAVITANSLAGIAVTLLLFMLAKTAFPKESKNKLFAYAAIALVLLNGNLSFLEMLQNNALNIQSIMQHAEFTDLKQTAFPFLNFLSAHLLVTPYIIGFAVLLIAVKKILEGEFEKAAIIGLLPLFNFFAFLAGIVLLGAHAWWEKKARKPFAVALALSIPQMAYYLATREGPSAFLRLGWLAPSQDAVSIAVFWLQNLGLYIAVGAIGYHYASDKMKRMFIASAPLFIIGNVFIFAPFAWDNVKLFLFFFAVLAILSALGLKKISEKTHPAFATAIFIAMVLTGIFSIATVAANSNSTIYDSFDMKTCAWIEENTPQNALFLTDGQHTCVFAIAGRKVFLGDLEWMQTHGIDYASQLRENNAMLAGDCPLVKKNKIGYIYLEGYGGRHATVNETFLRENAEIVYSQDGRTVYKTSCQ